MAKQILIDDIRVSQEKAFSDFMKKLQGLEKELNSLVDQQLDNVKESEEILSSSRNKESEVNLKNNNLSIKIDQAQSLLDEANKIKEGTRSEIERLEALKTETDQKLDILNKGEASLQIRLQEVTKKEQVLEMQERRLIFFNKKLEMVAQDKEITERLKQLE